MSGSLIMLMGVLSLTTMQHRGNYTGDTIYHYFPKFWTNSGLCPAGKITHEEIKASLLSDAMQMNLLYISALPKGAVTHLRIHWLLELIQFEQFTQTGVPIYDFSVLDKFLMNLDEMNLSPVIEFMANLSDLFIKNPSRNDFMWEDLSDQITKHYLNLFGAKKVLNWRFETWNEPDLLSYNKLNFSIEEFITYTQSLQYGLKMAGARPVNSLHFPLRGPAGLFKSQAHHPLCWSILEFCNDNLTKCPFEVLTYHRKGSGENATVVLEDSQHLLAHIYGQYPNLKQMSISNDEADPISGWSTPRDFQEDVRYAKTLVNIILEHWTAKLNSKQFINLETISHDNAFLSYHPYEFSQRTLLAHFRMNNTNPPHSQFIQKPVYSALGLLARLADMASDIEIIETSNGKQLRVLKTTVSDKYPLYLCWLVVSPDEDNASINHENLTLPPIHMCDNEIYGFIVEILDQSYTNPVNIWHSFNRPAYPNASIREAMRRQQTPKLLETGILGNTTINIDFSSLKSPWLILLRVCSILRTRLKSPQNVLITPVTHNEIVLTWQEVESIQCLKTYEIWYKASTTHQWLPISSGWHLPFPSFHYAPLDGSHVNGFYKVRGIDIFNNTSLFSAQIEYIEIK